MRIQLAVAHTLPFRPQYASFGFDLAEVNKALELAARGIVCANWLAATARKELQRFKEFIMWIKSGMSPRTPRLPAAYR